MKSTRYHSPHTMLAHALLTTSLALICPSCACAQLRLTPPEVNDAYATESVEHWNNRHVPDLTVSDDAKVGTHSLVGTFGFTWNISLSCGSAIPWNLTRHEKLRFWARADRASDNLLVMLLTKGLDNRRDAVVGLATDWKLYELPLDEETFHKNVQGNADFARVRSILFYNNQKHQMRIWLDGLELAGNRPGREPKSTVPGLSEDGSARALKLLDADPSPHLEEARAARHEARPRYDVPPVAFNRDNAFPQALVDFDQVRDWKVVLHDAEGRACLSTDQTLRGVPNLKVELTITGEQPRVVLVPPKPIRIGQAFDIVESWVYAHKHGGKLAYQFRLDGGSLLAIGQDYSDIAAEVSPKPVGQFWNLSRLILPDVIPSGAELIAIHLTPTVSERYKDPTYLFHLDQLRVLHFGDYLKNPAPQFNNVGEIVDNFPVHEDGACPQTTEPVKADVTRVGDTYHFVYTTQSGEELHYVYSPQTGTLSDLTIEPKGKLPFRPAEGSGPLFEFRGTPFDSTRNAGAKLVECDVKGKALVATWQYPSDAGSAKITYEFSLRGKTLRIKASSQGRHVERWLFGRASGLRNARVLEVPFMLYSPNVLLTDDLFVTYYTDWYASNVSMMPYGAQNSVEGDTAGYSWRDDTRRGRGYRYLKRTDGRRHPFNEVFYITASSSFDDVMLTVSNPPSPMKHVLKKRLYRMVLASTPGIFKRAKAFVDLCDQYGMSNYYFLFHAPLWFRRRAGSEAFPGDMHVSMLHEPEGGDEGMTDLFAHMRDKGVFPGYYDGYPARDVTAPSFRYDWTLLNADGGWTTLWRCPALKPWAFPELANTLCKARARKFGTRVAYQDGITSHIITYANDYDHRYPNSGLLRESMRALATGWQRCRENVNGPVFSEGRGSDFYTAGLNDGDYSKLKGYWDDKPCTEDRVQLFVDFRLKKLGPLSAPVSLNIGYAGFAATNKIGYESWYAKTDYAYLHHFLATQVAFAAIGMLEPYWPLWDDPKLHFDQTMRCYFLMQQLQERYLMQEVEEIRYFDGGKLLSTSDALRANVVKDNRLHIRYKNGLMLWINVNWDGEHWQVTDRGETYELPPGGWLARQGDDFMEFSAIIGGGRVDFVDSPEYVYLDGHGRAVEVNGFEAEWQWVRWKTGARAGRVLAFPEQ